jgi:putative heme iron utilization protein
LDDLEKKHTGIDIIYPPEDFKVNRLTANEKKILIGFEQGVSAGKQFLTGKA